jgi:hypothetical protein
MRGWRQRRGGLVGPVLIVAAAILAAALAVLATRQSSGDGSGTVTATARPAGVTASAGTPAATATAIPSQLSEHRRLTVAHGVVAGHPVSRPLIVEIARDVDRAVPDVRTALDIGWDGSVDVLVPADVAEFVRLAGAQGPGLRGVAALAVVPLPVPATAPASTGPGGTARRSGLSGVSEASGMQGQMRANGAAGTGRPRVLVNTQVFRGLSTTGRQVVLRHELTHVASGPLTAADTPLWLVEGLAEAVGYAQSGVPVRSAASELSAELAEGRWPSELPTDAAFAGGGDQLTVTYQQAWLACRLVVSEVGMPGLVRLYRLAADPRAGVPGPERLRSALATVLSVTPEVFTSRWIAYLRSQLT